MVVQNMRPQITILSTIYPTIKKLFYQKKKTIKRLEHGCEKHKRKVLLSATSCHNSLNYFSVFVCLPLESGISFHPTSQGGEKPFVMVDIKHLLIFQKKVQ